MDKKYYIIKILTRARFRHRIERSIDRHALIDCDIFYKSGEVMFSVPQAIYVCTCAVDEDSKVGIEP